MRSVIRDFQAAVDAGDVAHIAPLLADDVVLFGSVQGKPFEGKAAGLFVFAMLIELFSDVQYTAEYAGPEGLVLLNRGTVGGKAADGVQVLTFGNDGLITQFRDFVRPLSATSALRDAAGEYLSRM
jgi:ketosteroid isomerase-like protein